MLYPRLIEGNRFSDERGRLNFFNNFDLSEIVRMYEIAPNSIDTIRAWQGHKVERKWFYCTQGAFIINVVRIDDFEAPSTNLKPIQTVLNENQPNVLAVTGGCATGIKASKAGSKLLVFSDFTVTQSKEDDFRFDKNFWQGDWQS